MVPPKFIALGIVEGQMRFSPTIIGFPYNAGIAVYTTNVMTRLHINGSRGNFNRFQSGAISPLALRVSGGFCQSTFLCHCLWIGSPVGLIICENGGMSRLEIARVPARSKLGNI